MHYNIACFGNKVKCPVKWFCRAMNKYITVSKNAIYINDGWICDCGNFVKGVDVIHRDIVFGEREIIFLREEN